MDLDAEVPNGKPVTTISTLVDDNVAVNVWQYQRMTTRYVSVMGVSHISVHKNLTENLGKRKVCDKPVQHLLTNGQKAVNFCAAHLQRHHCELENLYSLKR